MFSTHYYRALGALGAVSAACSLLLGGCSDSSGPLPTCSVATGTHVTLAVGQWVSLDPASTGGCFVFPANASSSDSAEYLLLPQSAALIPGDSSSFRLQAGAVSGTATEVAAPPPRSNAAVFDAFLRRAGSTGVFPAARPSLAPAGLRAAPGSAPVLGELGSFVVCGNLACSQTQTVAARAEAVGAQVAIYVDTINPAGSPTAGLDTADLDTLIQVFDSRLYNLAATTFGPVSDIDGNGVVIALMTPVVNRLVTRVQCDTAGFVAGFFFAGDLYPGITGYNRGEIFYSVVPDPDSVASCAHTTAQVKRLAPTTFIHELQHMINFAQHVLVRGVTAEEGWLDEGLSKYAEELAARTYLPGDPATFHQYIDLDDLYDAYQYLADPGAATLVIPYDQGTIADVGASWLFVRYLMDQYGGSLAGQLVQSPYHGSRNIEVRTSAAFDSLVAQWGLANWVSDLPGFAAPQLLRYTSWSFRASFDTLHTQRPTQFPQVYPLVPTATAGGAVALTGWLRAGSGMYSRALQGPGGAGFALRFSADGTLPINTLVAPRLAIVRIR